MRGAPEIVLSDEEREVLDELIRSKLTSVRLALRARIVLLAAQGLQTRCQRRERLAPLAQERPEATHCARLQGLARLPRFVEKLQDIVGLYLSPPEHALVLCCDEKSQVQALHRRQPGLPMKKGRAASMTPDYKRNGTTTLFAALNVRDGQVSQCSRATPTASG